MTLKQAIAAVRRDLETDTGAAWALSGHGGADTEPSQLESTMGDA